MLLKLGNWPKKVILHWALRAFKKFSIHVDVVLLEAGMLK